MSLQITWINEACKILNCGFVYSNPADLIWGSIDNGSFTGHYHELQLQRVDLITGGNILTFARSLVGEKKSNF